MGILGCGVLVFALFFQCHSRSVQNPMFRFKRFQDNAWSDPNDCSRTRQPFVLSNPYNFSLDIRIPGVIPTESDSYYCMAVPVPTSREAYIVDFVPHASMDTAHHMILYGCKTPYATQGYWDCGKEPGTCRDQPKIMYAWARNAPPTKLPKDVGFKVGGDTKINYFVLQIHYGDAKNFRDHHRDCSGLTLRMTSKPQPFIAGMYLMMSVNTVIPPGKKVTNADIACTYTSSPMYPFAFRTHTHSLGKVVSGYRVRNGQWTQIGRQSPLLPQAFYPATNSIDVKNGDILAARCVFTGEGRTTITHIGGTSNDEMCNFYIMYYMDNSHAVPYMNCGDDGSSELFQNIPSEASIPIPVSPDHMMSMKHESAPHKDSVELQEPKRDEEVLDQGDLYSLLSKLLGEREDVVHMHKYNPAEAARAQTRLMAEIDSIMQKKDLGWPRLGYKTKEDAILVRDRVHKFHQLESTVSPSRSKTVPARRPTAGAAQRDQQGAHLVEVSDWSEAELQLGQVSGLALNSNGDLIIFHRGDHKWGFNSFDFNGIYQQRDLGPIQQSTIVVVDPVKGKVLKASGRNMFYMPHGITTDKDDNYWVTDVALHQVFKLSSDGKDRQLLVLGEAFEPGSDKKHFCQPTDVAVDPVTGNVYVSDGYCNSRILKFSSEGKYISHWGAGSSDRKRRVSFLIPHSLAFLPDKRELCVADRDNGRIQCFMADTGEFVKEIKKEQFGGEVFAIAYSPAQGGLIYAVNGVRQDGQDGQVEPLQGFVINYSTKEILDSFSPETQKFKVPHDIVVTADGSVFVGDAASDSVIKFVQSEKAEHRSVKKGGIEVQEIEETETFVQANLKPLPKFSAPHPVAPVQKIQEPSQKQHQQPLTAPEAKETTKTAANQSAQGVSTAIITTLLLIPLVVVIAIGAFVRWKRGRMYSDDCQVKLEPSGSTGGILGKIRGKAAGSLNLGNFFATHKGYTRHGFDRLSTEGSDLEKDDEDGTDSENEEYSAPPPPMSSS
ncbi:peptidyl-glycine alpha-amidating monooxygenase isoform X1 [Labeo rohita]|uniref:Peptidyl-glycine alpha-amidating monooxygenase isoform X1 n=1 Tax=Labeo rohita TaxID=84645 RepID=A0A498LXA1_LABRO|nr:peptidyl-glycine alpha-amidating monooxygenase B isoform X1 [Labeo rohita]XP_050976462.1 peptidyl-glycine alpha-amidating monooxygenase B isoform X1 [Labeo rohita]RXN11816.1 peptidyl-glycine alpha-amidating monooxygenase isoform X1 [Labeo rohita]